MLAKVLALAVDLMRNVASVIPADGNVLRSVEIFLISCRKLSPKEDREQIDEQVLKMYQ